MKPKVRKLHVIPSKFPAIDETTPTALRGKLLRIRLLQSGGYFAQANKLLVVKWESQQTFDEAEDIHDQ